MPIKILSVDDEMDLELLLTQYFRRKIRKGEYEFSFAHNGLEALTMLLKNKDYDIILSDINMPEMDGLTLLTKINEMQNPALKCIMVSAYGDMGNIRQAMNNGAFDFATKPIDLDDLSVTIEKAIEQIKYIRAMEKEHIQLESLKGDLAVAHEIQQAILPRDFFKIDDEHIGFTIADVSGKGIPAAIFMAVSRTLIRATALHGVSPAECMTYSNKLLAKESVNCMFVTVFYGIYNTTTGEVNYCNAGHNPPYIIKNNGEVKAFPMPSQPIVGILSEYDFEEEKMKLEKGDALFLFTDGVTEAMNPTFEEFGEPRFEETLRKSASLDCQAIIDATKTDLAAFVGDAEQSDDITMLALRRLD